MAFLGRPVTFVAFRWSGRACFRSSEGRQKARPGKRVLLVPQAKTRSGIPKRRPGKAAPRTHRDQRHRRHEHLERRQAEGMENGAAGRLAEPTAVELLPAV